VSPYLDRSVPFRCVPIFLSDRRHHWCGASPDALSLFLSPLSARLTGCAAGAAECCPIRAQALSALPIPLLSVTLLSVTNDADCIYLLVREGKYALQGANSPTLLAAER
jgi:hypothetical protein